MSQDRVTELLFTDDVPARPVDTVGLWSAFSPPPAERKAQSLEYSLRGLQDLEPRGPAFCEKHEARVKVRAMSASFQLESSLNLVFQLQRKE